MNKYLQNSIIQLQNDERILKLFQRIDLIKEQPQLSIIIYDDKDNDGLMSAFLIYQLLKYLYPNQNIEVHHNIDHGVLPENLVKTKDLHIIVDSSTNLADQYKTDKEVIIIDHHEIEIDLNTLPNNITVLNSNNFKGLENVSAGAFCYLITQTYILMHQLDYPDYVSIAALTCYSDIVPIDNTVAGIIIGMLENEEHGHLLDALNIYHVPLTKTVMQYYISPLINYTRRLQDTNTITSLVEDVVFDCTIKKLMDNKKTSKDILKLLDSNLSTCLKQFKNFIFVDITSCTEFIPYPVGNFKGIYCNQIQDRYGVPCITGFLDEKGFFNISVRSSFINSLAFFQGLKNFEQLHVTGGGHKPACGFKFPYEELEEILDRYDTYLATSTRDKNLYELEKIEDIEDLDSEELLNVAIANEYCFSNKKPYAYYLEDFDGSDISRTDGYGGFLIGDYLCRTYDALGCTQDVVIIPTLVSYKLKKYELVIKIVE